MTVWVMEDECKKHPTNLPIRQNDGKGKYHVGDNERAGGSWPVVAGMYEQGNCQAAQYQ
ncbi:hypothetical protein IBA8402_33150 [Pseudomonas syringae]